MSLRRGRARAELMGDINVVSLIDVMMLLLVIFMITAPMMSSGVDLVLPKADAAPIDPKGMTVSITARGVFIDDTPFTDRNFRVSFKTLAGKRAKDGVFIRADSSVSVQRLTDVMGVMRAAGVDKFSILTEPKQ